MLRVSEHAEKQRVTLVIEPVNRYETNYINSVTQGIELVKQLEKFKVYGIGLMPDFFHMNIEDASMDESLRQGKDMIKYIHAADSNRLAPGWGHTDFSSLFGTLDEIGYNGWVTVEALPLPTPEEAARQAVLYLKKFIRKGHA